MGRTNIKNLPEGKYFTERGYSDSYPWIVVKETAKTKTLARVAVTKDSEWKPKFHPGGFVANCSNQEEQTWLFDKIDYSVTKTIRNTKRGWAHQGTRFTENTAIHFYDYNF